ncbi:hypothetical protein OS493_019270 [Desmophyllum pertusum]|uniref:Uncharacterized protein n=1 Tax=Desmophyllum pertusum TaxID=174260 RepID=A0A9X0CEQ0_9CNID|nr:hypothetical protein OS493_019270 [Desmophyllum pertusum]
MYRKDLKSSLHLKIENALYFPYFIACTAISAEFDHIGSGSLRGHKVSFAICDEIGLIQSLPLVNRCVEHLRHVVTDLLPGWVKHLSFCVRQHRYCGHFRCTPVYSRENCQLIPISSSPNGTTFTTTLRRTWPKDKL